MSVGIVTEIHIDNACVVVTIMLLDHINIAGMIIHLQISVYSISSRGRKLNKLMSRQGQVIQILIIQFKL